MIQIFSLINFQQYIECNFVPSNGVKENQEKSKGIFFKGKWRERVISVPCSGTQDNVPPSVPPMLNVKTQLSTGKNLTIS